MPIVFVLPAIAGGMAGLSFGAAVGTAIGLTGITAGIVGGAIVGAVVGAVVGGITAAVTGGDIMDGVLFGAIGGAVGGALGGFYDAGGFSSFGMQGGFSEAGKESIAMSALDSGGAEAITGMTSVGKEVAKGGIMAGLKGEGQAALIAAGSDYIGKLLTPEVEVNEAGLTAAEAEGARQFNETLAENKRQTDLLANKKPSGGGGSSAGHAPNYQREVATIQTESAEKQTAMNAQNALDVAAAKSSDLRGQLAANKEEIQGGYLREDQMWQRMRDTTGNVLITRIRSDGQPGGSPPVEDGGPTPPGGGYPQTPNYIPAEQVV